MRRAPELVTCASSHRCITCGKPFGPRKRKHAKTCGPACRQVQVRRRKGIRPLDIDAADRFEIAELKMQADAFAALLEKQMALR